MMLQPICRLSIAEESKDVDLNLNNLMREAFRAIGQEWVFHFVEHFPNTLYVLFIFTIFLFWLYVKQLMGDSTHYLHSSSHIHEFWKWVIRFLFDSRQSLSCTNQIIFPMFFWAFLLLQIVRLVIANNLHVDCRLPTQTF